MVIHDNYLRIICSDGVSRPIFVRLDLGFKGFISVSKVTGLGHKPIVLRLCILQGYGLVTLLEFNELFLFYFQVRNNKNRSEKCQKFEKFQLESDDIFLKIFSKIHKFGSAKSWSWCWSSSLEVVTRSQSQRLLSSLHNWLFDKIMLSEVCIAQYHMDEFEGKKL